MLVSEPRGFGYILLIKREASLRTLLPSDVKYLIYPDSPYEGIYCTCAKCLSADR